jgi:hypothetical protein
MCHKGIKKETEGLMKQKLMKNLDSCGGEKAEKPPGFLWIFASGEGHDYSSTIK